MKVGIQPPNILANMLFYMVQQRMTIGWGMTLRFATLFPEFADTYNKAAIYITYPFGVPQGFSQVRCQGDVGSVYMACYISEAERQYFLDRGAKNFEAHLREQDVDVFRLTREFIRLASDIS